ncbi:hypothetical protein [Methylorubrum extorquens]|uniref:Uncharacterized protein n=1 Tax=Methylorubrum extorquens TaxID=408 RepID=A0AAX3WDE3_METEX|nr:hypothetical protein [Methylorubrum extorquens]WHQ68650.1 hypothetical protein KEC54_20105 [Methylorubrum extorquens]
MARRPIPGQTSLVDMLDLTLAPPPAASPAEALVAAGITTPFLLTLGAIQDRSVPYAPRSIAFPVRYVQPHGEEPRLILSTPACADLPFVQRVESVSGLRAVWDPTVDSGLWHHAVDLATDEGWRRLAGSMAHTRLECVERGVGLNLTWGKLSTENARALLAAVGSVEPEGRSATDWDGITEGSEGGIGIHPRGGWWAIHGIEDGWYTPGGRKGQPYEKLTPAGWARIGKAPPAPVEKRLRKEAA